MFASFVMGVLFLFNVLFIPPEGGIEKQQQPHKRIRVIKALKHSIIFFIILPERGLRAF